MTITALNGFRIQLKCLIKFDSSNNCQTVVETFSQRKVTKVSIKPPFMPTVYSLHNRVIKALRKQKRLLTRSTLCIKNQATTTKSWPHLGSRSNQATSALNTIHRLTKDLESNAALTEISILYVEEATDHYWFKSWTISARSWQNKGG